ncbi:MAG: hypothetical protein ABI666_04090 [Ferruginibacter sp.]
MKISEEQQQESLKAIITAFGTYALGDIKYTAKKKPIAAFILCVCFIDQISTFLFGRNKFNDFILKFMPTYEAMDLYSTLRNGLVHNYSTKGYYGLTYNKLKSRKENNQNLRSLNLHRFIDDIENAFRDIEVELLRNGEIRNHAINWDRNHFAVIRDKKYKAPLYSSKECKILIQKYLKLLINRRILDNNKKYKITNIIKVRKKKGYTIEVIATLGNFDYYYDLNDAAERFNLIQPQAFLKTLDLSS